MLCHLLSLEIHRDEIVGRDLLEANGNAPSRRKRSESSGTRAETCPKMKSPWSSCTRIRPALTRANILLSKTTPIFDAVTDAIEAVSGSAPIRSRISVAIVDDLTQYFAGAIGLVIKSNPEIELSIRVRRSPETVALVVNGQVDLGVGYFGAVPRDIVKTTLLQSGYSLIFSSDHPLARRRKPTLEEIARHRLISFPTQTNMGRRIINAFAAEGLLLRNPIEAGSCQSSKEFAEVGVGAAIVHTACLGDKRSRHLHVRNLGQTFGVADIAVIRRRSLILSDGHNAVIERLSRYT